MASAKDRKQLRVLGENEWACSNAKCLFVNSVKVIRCERCGKGMPRGRGKVGVLIGKEASEKSKGLFSAEDWACTKCGNINWARRTTCNICNAPKLGEVEARTGYGGGYMDRQNVEYRSRPAEEEEEFDEFGRRRKRAKEEEEEAKEASSSGAAKIARLADFEEDEEDGDEDDLGKYDFEDLDKPSPAHSYDSDGSCCSHSSCSCSGTTCYSSDPEAELERDETEEKKEEKKEAEAKAEEK